MLGSEVQVKIGIQGGQFISKNLPVIKIKRENGLHSQVGFYGNLASLMSRLGLQENAIFEGCSKKKVFNEFTSIWQTIADSSGKSVVLIKGVDAPRIFAEIRPRKYNLNKLSVEHCVLKMT